MSLEGRPNVTRKVENPTDEMVHLEYYKHKENSIQRHSEDARTISFACLAVMTQKKFANASEHKEKYPGNMDNLDLK